MGRKNKNVKVVKRNVEQEAQRVASPPMPRYAHHKPRGRKRG